MGRNSSFLVTDFSQALLRVKRTRESRNSERDDNETNLQSAAAGLFSAWQNDEALARTGLAHFQTWSGPEENGAPPFNVDHTPFGGAGVFGPAAAGDRPWSLPTDHVWSVEPTPDNAAALVTTAN